MHRRLLSSACPVPRPLVAGRHFSLQQAQPRQPALVQQTRLPEAGKHKAAAPCSAVQDTVEAAPQAWDGLVDEKAALHHRMVHWYPGHIAKAERQLREQLKNVDVILEVRDARIPMSTCHPQIQAWAVSKPILVLLNRMDAISADDQKAWGHHFARQRQPVFWTNAAEGTGVLKASKAAQALSMEINSKRQRRGLKARAVRAVVIGFPNVGKSALINRFLGKRLCDSAPKPGVTKHLRWLRIGADLDMLDAPGVLPAAFTDQVAAQRLAMCNDIGEASYVDSLIAAALVERLLHLPAREAHLEMLRERLHVRYEPGMSGEDYIVALANLTFQGDAEKAGQRLLGTFRQGRLGPIALELPSSL